MRIRTQQTLLALVTVVTIGIIATALLISTERTSRAIAISDFADDLNAQGISGLRLVTIEYVLHRHERARLQWLQRHESFGRILANDLLKGQPEQATIDQLRQRNSYLKEIFSEMVALETGARPESSDVQAISEYRGRLLTQLMVATQDMVAEVSALANITHQQLEKAQYRTTVLIMVLLALIGMLIAANFIINRTQILAPVLQLQSGAFQLAKGDFDVRTRIDLDNEIGDLSRTFDRMTESLASAAEALKQKSLQVEEANRELESFSYSVSHDLRAPLRGIDGWSLALLEDYGSQLDETASGYLRQVRAESQRMGALIDDILQLSRINRGERRREPVDLSAIALAAAERLRLEYPGRSIQFEIQPGLAATGDARLLEIVLTNLLGNACKFTGPRTVARIEFGCALDEASEARPSRRRYFVRDNGVGFDMKFATRLFGAFQRMHKAGDFPGSGIGLATVRRIIQRHGGEIRADAAPDKGATFSFTLGEDDPS